MTVSMLTTKLSSVITGCGGKETTFSRRSTSGLTRSIPGIIKFSPGTRVRWYLPSLSTIPARAWGIILIAETTMTIAITISTIRAILAADMKFSLFVCIGSFGNYDCDGTVYAGDEYLRSGWNRTGITAGRPRLITKSDCAHC